MADSLRKRTPGLLHFKDWNVTDPTSAELRESVKRLRDESLCRAHADDVARVLRVVSDYRYIMDGAPTTEIAIRKVRAIRRATGQKRRGK